MTAFVVALVLAGGLTPGEHAVGFQVMAGQSVPGSAGWDARPIEVAVWYPAAGGGRAMRFADYFALAGDLRRRAPSIAVAITGAADGLTAAQEGAILTAPMAARRDAPAANGTFPVVMWSARYGTVAAQSILSEYLASHGYVVAAVRPAAAEEKLPFELQSDVAKFEELDAQTDDLRGALRLVRALPVADDVRTALIAWSYAGESAWRLARGDARIEMVIGLDTNVHRGWVYQKKADPVPIDFSFVSLDRETEDLKHLAHGNFNALEGMIPAVAGVTRVQRWSSSGPEAKRGYETIARRVRATLDGTFARRPTMPYETVELTAADGSAVTAEHYAAPSPGGCVALFHQSGSSRGEYRTIAPQLVRLGYTALAVDVRWGQNDRWNDVINETARRHDTPAVFASGDRTRAVAVRTAAMHDLDAAVDWLRARGCEKPVVWGASIMANGVFELASRRPDVIGGVVDVSPGEYQRDEPERMRKIVSQVRTPALVLWGRTERDLSKPIFDALPGPHKWSYASTGRHGNALVFEDVAAWQHIRDFLAGR